MSLFCDITKTSDNQSQISSSLGPSGCFWQIWGNYLEVFLRCWITSAGMETLPNVILLARHHGICCCYSESSKHASTEKIPPRYPLNILWSWNSYSEYCNSVKQWKCCLLLWHFWACNLAGWSNLKYHYYSGPHASANTWMCCMNVSMKCKI